MPTDFIDNATYAAGVMSHASAIMADGAGDPKARMELALCLDEFAETYDDECAVSDKKTAMDKLGDSFAQAGAVYKELGGTFEKRGSLGDDMRHVAREAYTDALYDVMRAHDWETTRDDIDRFAPAMAGCAYVRNHEPFADATFDLVGDKRICFEHGRAYWANKSDVVVEHVLSDDPERREMGFKWFDMALDAEENARYNLPMASPKAVACAVVDANKDKAVPAFVLVENHLVETGRLDVAAAASHAFAVATHDAGLAMPRAEVSERRLPNPPSQQSLSNIDPDFARFE